MSVSECVLAIYLPMVNPVSSSACSYQTLQLVGLHPDKLIDSLVSPQRQTFSPQFHGSSSHPQEDETIVLQRWNIELTHLIITHGT